MSTAARSNCFDASALLKLYVHEDGSEKLRTYWQNESTKFTTSLCFYEALSMLKVYHFHRKILDLAAYKKATLNLCAWYGTVLQTIPEPNFLSPEIFFTVQRTAETYALDLSDAFQIHSVKQGFFSRLSGDSKTIFVTADKKLANAAKTEGIDVVWYILDGPAP